MASISACHAEDPGSIPGLGDIDKKLWAASGQKIYILTYLKLYKNSSLCDFQRPDAHRIVELLIRRRIQT